ncbi:biotin--[acetyl-CoA-carboxylase] ligase [Corynebacterium sp. zg-331]|uniref:biotin--[acetyl-CoA-carboxylase] ligase n=1 Tax=unclassified Corynebacterium TaxID=2624378 RepID=UPI00128C5B2A|nr:MULTISPECIES: biotin--[acetyl-CoA-carboxylase] ligase [unclassified Corynebacterium]MBC3185919.1 biotin--[acetyl-CoA-carboxylase] ligase [Corynebacterium sp. zg-331]MPV52410.1 biotin--[acetyl-CoA-carboxylase] ligase [Corynebacterium sp. zg331]
MDEAALRRHLGGRAGSYSRLRVVAQTGSTNADLLEQGDAPDRAVLIARHQTAGRGRLHRHWVGVPDKQLAISVLYRPGIKLVDRLGLLPLAVGLAVVDTVPRAALKWPNDVLLGGRKVCGILVEAADLDAAPRVVVGCGINLALDRDELPVDHATSLVLEGLAHEPAEIAAGFLNALEDRVQQWYCASPALLRDYRARCATLGAEVRVERWADSIEGTAVDVSATGALIVETDRGRQEFSAGDVTHLRRAVEG